MDIKGVNFNDPNLYKDVDWSKVDFTAKPAVAPETMPTPALAPPQAFVAPPPQDPASFNAPASQSQISSQQVSSILSGAGSAANSTQSGSHATAGFGGRTAPIDSGDANSYIGNVGSPYGSNMLVLPPGANPSSYKYTNTFTNTTGRDETIYVWNKSGKDGRPFSGQSDLGNALAVKIPAGGQATVAFDENSQVAWAKDTGERNGDGSIKGTWGEADFGDLRNLMPTGAPSGYDVNTAPGNNGFMQISSNGAAPDQSTTGLHWSETTAADNFIVPGEVRLNTTLGE